MRNKKLIRLLAYVTGTVNQELLLQNEYLAAEDRILSAKLPTKLLFPSAADKPKKRGHSVECRHRLGGLLKYYGRAA